MSKSPTYDRRRSLQADGVIWQLAQVFWVGGLWLMHFGVLPGLRSLGLAPLLIDDVSAFVGAWLVAFSALCLVLQAALLVYAQDCKALLADVRGQLLLGCGLACVLYACMPWWQAQPVRGQLFCYLLLGAGGLLLVLQPAPQRLREPA